MRFLRLDLQSAWRQLRLNPGYALLSMGVLGLGIGLVTSQFAVLHGVIYRGLPFPDADRLIHLERNHFEKGDINAEVPIHDLNAYREAQTTLAGMAGFSTGTVNVSDGKNPIRFNGCFASANLFEVLQVSPLRGRTFPEGSDQYGAPPVVVLSYDAWQNHFGGSEAVIGQRMQINGLPGEIIGVMPDGFGFPTMQQVWMPHRVYPERVKPGEGGTFEVVARMKPKVTLDEVEAELSVVAAQIEKLAPDAREGMRLVDAKPFVREYLGKEPMALLYLMLIMGLLILAVACANVANLTLARVARRRREMAIRASLGASRDRLWKQMLMETLLLAAGGTVFGILLTQGIITWMGRSLAHTDQPFWIRVEIDLWVSICAAGVMVGAGLLAGFYPARQASKVNLNDLLKDSGRGSSLHLAGFSRLLVVAQISISCAVLLMALLMVRAQWAADHFAWPFATDKVFTARMGLFEGVYPDDAARQRFYRELLRAARAQPMVESAALGTRYRFDSAPVRTWGHDGETSDEETRPYPYTRYEPVSDGYFAALGVPLVRGREFVEGDAASEAKVVIINSPFAALYFADRDPLGRRLFFPKKDDEGNQVGVWRTIIGVAPDLRMQMHSDWEQDHGQGVYVPLAEESPRFVTLLGRGPDSPAALAPVFRRLVARLDSNLPLYETETIAQSVYDLNRLMRFFLRMFLGFGMAATFLAGAGIFGVVSFGVNQRTNEIGIRMALGATRKRILRWVYLGAWKPWALGIVLGLFLGEMLVVGVWIHVFNGIEAQFFDHFTIALLISLIVALAILAPALRASRITPLEALRRE